MINNLFAPVRWRYMPRSHTKWFPCQSAYLHDYVLPTGQGIHWTLSRLHDGKWSASAMISYPWSEETGPGHATGWKQGIFETWERTMVFFYRSRNDDYTGKVRDAADRLS